MYSIHCILCIVYWDLGSGFDCILGFALFKSIQVAIDDMFRCELLPSHSSSHQTNNSTYGQSDRSNGHPMGLPAVQIVHLKIAVNLTVRRKLATYR